MVELVLACPLCPDHSKHEIIASVDDDKAFPVLVPVENAPPLSNVPVEKCTTRHGTDLPVLPHEVYTLQKYELVRRSVPVDGLSKRQASEDFGLNRRTIAKMVEHSLPPGYQPKAPRARPKLGPFLACIAQVEMRQSAFQAN